MEVVERHADSRQWEGPHDARLLVHMPLMPRTAEHIASQRLLREDPSLADDDTDTLLQRLKQEEFQAFLCLSA